MNLLSDDLLIAVGAIAPPLFVSAVSRLLDELGPVLTADQAGGVLAAALCPERKYGTLGDKALVGCEIYQGGEVVWLTPAQCAMNPGLSDWAPPSLGQAFALPIETSFALTRAIVPVPVFESAGVVIAEGHCSGQLALTFQSGARVIVYYGQRTAKDLFASTAFAVAGDALCAMGDHLRHVATEAETAAIEAEGRERAGVGATVH